VETVSLQGVLWSRYAGVVNWLCKEVSKGAIKGNRNSRLKAPDVPRRVGNLQDPLSECVNTLSKRFCKAPTNFKIRFTCNSHSQPSNNDVTVSLLYEKVL